MKDKKDKRTSLESDRMIGVFIGIGVLFISVLILSIKDSGNNGERNVNNEVNHSYVDTTKRVVGEKTNYVNEFDKRVEKMSEKDKKNEFGYSSKGNFEWGQRIAEVVEPTDFDKPTTTEISTDVEIQEKKRVERKQQLDVALYSANNYEATEEEISEFKDELITNYTQDEYINEIYMPEYSIPTEFKAKVVENYATEQEDEDLKAFAHTMVLLVNIGYEDANNMKADTVIEYQSILLESANNILAQK